MNRTIARLAPLTALALSTALVAWARQPVSAPAHADPCTSISPRVLDSYAGQIAQAQRSAIADANRNGTSGRYAVAAINSRDLLNRAHDRALAASRDLSGADPTVTTAAEAGQTKEHVRAIIELLPQAAHWATISEIYHDSPDARRAFEGIVAALERGDDIFAEAARCYMDGL